MKKLWDLKKVFSNLELKEEGRGIIIRVTRLLLLGQFYTVQTKKDQTFWRGVYIHTELHSSLIRKLDFAERYFEVLHSTYMRLRMQNLKLYVVKLNEQNWELDQAVVICGTYVRILKIRLNHERCSYQIFLHWDWFSLNCLLFSWKGKR